MIGLLRSVLSAPAAMPAPPRRVWRDWALVALIVPLILIEGLSQWTKPGLPAWTVVTLLLVPTLLWRRQHPFTMLAIAYLATELTSFVIGRDLQLVSSSFILVLVYAVFRWGTGRARVGAVALVAVSLVISTVQSTEWIPTLIGGGGVMAVTTLLGLLFRQRATARLRELETVRVRERAELARDLHDIVAHHVSAITVQAQAGIATAAKNPEAAVAALTVIEAEASRALSEMRAMVRTLRDTEAAELAPLPGVAELLALAGGASGPSVGVRTDGAIDDLPPGIAAALYRLAQESVTNARRHARGATLIDVLLVVDGNGAVLTVRDNGEGGSSTGSHGFGIPGMTERASLLGGSFTAGPDAGGGWVTRAALPRAGWTA